MSGGSGAQRLGGHHRRIGASVDAQALAVNQTRRPGCWPYPRSTDRYPRAPRASTLRGRGPPDHRLLRGPQRAGRPVRRDPVVRASRHRHPVGPLAVPARRGRRPTAVRRGLRRTRRPSRHPAGRATDREVRVVAAVLVSGSEKTAAHRLGLSPSTVQHHLANARSRVGSGTTEQLVLDPRVAAAGARRPGPGRTSSGPPSEPIRGQPEVFSRLRARWRRSPA